jgi:twitching motility protein PilT
MRDLETIEMGVTAAETGHLVLGTLHTSDAASTLNRILAVFPPMQQSQIRSMLAESLRGIICQRLLPAADGEGQVLASEVLINTPAAANLIRDGRAHHLEGVMQTGVNQGMQTMDRDILRLFHQGTISEETALQNIRSREIIARLRKMRELMNTVQIEGGGNAPETDDASDTKSKRYIDSEDLG